MANHEAVSRREARRQRSEAERQQREQARRGRRVRSRAIAVGVVLALVATGVLYATRDRPTGRVWSAQHGHWHER